MRLQDLPSEVLCAITAQVTGVEVAYLWLCGLKSLQTKLSDASGVQRFAISFAELGPLCWPSLVSQFRNLQDLEMKDNRYKPKFHLTSDMLQRVPRTTRRLFLETSGCVSAFQFATSSDLQLFPHLQELRLLDLYDKDRIEKCSITQWPKLLETLQISISRSILLPLDLLTLPTTLTYLDGTFSELVAREGAVFPSNLQVLKLMLYLPEHADVSDLFVNFVNLLPQGLHTLSYYLYEGLLNLVPELDYSRLPSGLQSLSMQWSGKNPEEKYKARLLALPRSLTELTLSCTAVSNLVLSLLPYLPPNLTNAGVFTPHHITKESARQLPRSLKKLYMRSVDWNALPHLPPDVDSVRLYAADNATSLLAELESMQVSYIPVKIRRVHLFATNFPLHVLPPTVETIHFDIADEESYLDDGSVVPRDIPAAIFSDLPRQVTTLNIVNPTSTCTSEEVCINMFASMPRGLTSLVIRLLYTLAPSSAALLPRRLTELRFSLAKLQGISKEWLANLPETLQILSIQGNNVDGTTHDWEVNLPQHLSSLHLEFRKSPLEGYGNLLRSIPRRSVSLRTLRILDPECSESGVTNDILANALPKRLQILRLPASASITATCIAKLPRTLHTLLLGISTPSWWKQFENHR